MRLPPPPRDIAYASAARLLLSVIDGFKPARPVSVAAHARTHRWVISPDDGRLQRWDESLAPYLVEPMEALTTPGIDTVAVVGPGACGKTMIAENRLLHAIHADPAPLLWYLPTEPLADSYVKGRIEPMLDAHDALIGHLRHGRDSTSFKRFRGGRVEFLPFTGTALVNKHVAHIVADEYDNFQALLGDPLTLLNPRRQAALEAGAHSTLLLISHPDLGRPLTAPIEQQSGIMRVYLGSDRRTFWWQCPHCGAVSSPNPGTPRQMVLHWPEGAPPDEAEDAARLLCPVHGCLITDSERRRMLRGLTRWACEGQEVAQDGTVSGTRKPNRAAGFWITGTMSPFTKGGIGGLARARAEAEREMRASGDWRSLHQVMVKTWGEPYAPPAHLGSVDAAVLAERVEHDLKLGTVPDGVRFLTAWADAQINRWEILVRGWGEGGESWILLHELVPGDPAGSAVEWDRLLDRLATLSLPLADGSGRRMRVRAAGFDAFGQPGVTEQAYAAWLRRRQRGAVRRLGVIEGRDAWDLVPTKGNNSRSAPRIMVVYPNSQRKDRKTVWRGNVPLLLFAPNDAKDALAASLALPPPAANSVHIPAALLAEGGPPHPFLEGLAAERRDPVKRTWEPVSKGVRNEPLDLMVGCEVIARLHGLHRIVWERPPAWAQPWETNSMIVAPNQPLAETASAPAIALPAAAAPVARPPQVTPAPRVVTAATGPRSVAARLAG
jgi:phage terminase large subunit GpA-like protein